MTPPADLRRDFLASMSRTVCGVTVVGTAGRTSWVAQTVSAMCSVSAEPPILLVCINRRSPVCQAIEVNEQFAVSVLATGHDHVADTFAGRPWPGKERWDFTCGCWEAAPSGSPRVADALASFDCRLHRLTQAGTHRIYLGRVESVSSHPGEPLVYVDRDYGRPEPIEPSRFAEYPDAHPANRMRSRAR